jgi:hypothetical protein
VRTKDTGFIAKCAESVPAPNATTKPSSASKRSAAECAEACHETLPQVTCECSLAEAYDTSSERSADASSRKNAA